MSVTTIHAHRKRLKVSWPMLAKVLTDPKWPLRGNDRIVAVVIFMFANMTTLTCYPSIDEICRRAKVSPNTAYRAISELQRLGLMKKTKRRSAGGKFDGNFYDFNPLRTHLNPPRTRL